MRAAYVEMMQSVLTADVIFDWMSCIYGIVPVRNACMVLMLFYGGEELNGKLSISLAYPLCRPSLGTTALDDYTLLCYCPLVDCWL